MPTELFALFFFTAVRCQYMIEQARSALNRSESLMRESLASLPERSADEVDALADSLKAPLIDNPSSHSAVVSADDALAWSAGWRRRY